MLCRAIAYRTDPAHAHDEVLVFFDWPHPEGLAARATKLLSQVWDVAPMYLEVYNVFSEAELLSSMAAGAPSTGDARLLESGWNGEQVLYWAEHRVLPLVSARSLARLYKAAALVSVQQVDALCRRLPALGRGVPA